MPLWGLTGGWGWQEQMWATILDRHDGRPRYETVVIVICRQNGKTTGLYPLAWRWLRAGSRCLFTMHERKLALEKWDQVATALITAEPGRFAVRRRAGGERITDRLSGGFFALTTPDDAGGRSETADVIVIDEAAHISPAYLRAARAATLTRDDAQIVMISSGMTDRSEDMALARDDAIAGLTKPSPTTAILEWSGSDTPGHSGIDLDDRDLWASCIPTLGEPGGARVAAVEAARSKMPADEFAREYLSIATGSPLTPPITPSLWAQCQSEDAAIETAKVRLAVLGVDATPDQSAASVAVAAVMDDDTVRVALLAHGDGDGWLLSDVEAAFQALPVVAVVIDARNPAAHTFEALERSGMPVSLTGAQFAAQAAAGALSAVSEAEIAVVSDDALTVAACGAVRRHIADVGWAWDRRPDSGLDISPLVAVSLALHQLSRER